ncbi:MAG: helix-turn-helix domain-containing protein, partial [Pseudomonadota bacterium]
VYLRTRLAAYIRERRGGMPQREFARRIGVAQSTVMRVENLDQNVTLETLEQLCFGLRVDVAELFPPLQAGSIYPARPDVRPANRIHEPGASGEGGSDPDKAEKKGKRKRGR